MIEKCIRILNRQLDSHLISKDGCRNLIAAAEINNNQNIAVKAKARLESFNDTPIYDEDNLVITTGQLTLLARN
jgi:hypothetical protein